jgi:hypothetical protein
MAYWSWSTGPLAPPGKGGVYVWPWVYTETTYWFFTRPPVASIEVRAAPTASLLRGVALRTGVIGLGTDVTVGFVPVGRRAWLRF